MTSFSYTKRWALVTGASAGIGLEYARALAARGMDLVLAARRVEQLEVIAAELQERHGVRARALRSDLAVPGEAQSLFERASEIGPIHLLVSNAGFGLKGRFADHSCSRQAEMVQVNCTAVLELAHLALPGMVARGEGGIVNVASVSAFQPVPLMATYGATKAFVFSLSEALFVELAGTGVRVLAVCPGPVPTGFQAVAGTSLGGRKGILPANVVVARSLRALEAGRSFVVPGLLNRTAAALARLGPVELGARTAMRIVAGER